MIDAFTGLTWDAAMRMTGVKLELLKDVDMYLFIEQCIRGGLNLNIVENTPPSLLMYSSHRIVL